MDNNTLYGETSKQVLSTQAARAVLHTWHEHNKTDKKMIKFY